MRITALAGGIGGARFIRGLLHHLGSLGSIGAAEEPHQLHAGIGRRDRAGEDAHEVTVIGNTADDVTMHGLRICPDLDTLMYTLGGEVHEEQGWGRQDETFSVAGELAAHNAEPGWFTLGDKDIATHLVRTRMLNLGYPLSQVTEALAQRFELAAKGVRLVPMTDDPVETHVVIEDDGAEGAGAEGGGAEGGRLRAVHFQEWWVRLHAAVPARQILAVGIDKATPAPGVLAAIRDADVVLLPPSNPVVSIGTILAVPGVREAIRGTRAPVVGVSPIIGGAPVRGMADACLTAIGVETTSAAVAGLYADFLGGWLVAPEDAAARLPAGVAGRAVPLLMTDVPATAEIARQALDLAAELAK